MARLRAFISLSRLTFLPGGLLACALGVAVARQEHHALSWAAYLQAQWLVTSFHLMTHYSNEYFDRESDRGAVRTPFSGGSGVLVAGELPASLALRAALASAASGTLAVATFIGHGNTTTALLGLAVGALAWAYSAPPLRLLARGLGELTTSLVVGSLVPLLAYAAQTGAIDGVALAATLPSALSVFLMMIALEVPDLACDTASGKHNLLVRLGPRLLPRLRSVRGRSAAFVASAGVACFFITTLAMTFAFLLRT